MIQDQIHSKDKQQSQYLLNKLKEVQEDIILDKVTFAKIQAIVNNEKFDEKQVLERQQSNEIGIRVRQRPNARDIKRTMYVPHREDDSLRMPPMTYEQYQDYILDQADEQVELFEKFPPNDQLIQRLMSSSQQARFQQQDELEREDKYDQQQDDPYDLFLNAIKLLNEQQLAGEQNEFEIDRVTEDIDYKLKYIQEQNEFDKGNQNYYSDMSELEDPDTVYTKVREVFKKEKLEEQSERVTESVSKDVYYTMKDSLKNEYDQTRSLMKLNQVLRQRLASNIQGVRQMFQITQRQRDKYYNRLEAISKDFAFDVQSDKAFDFINQEKQISKRKSTRKEQGNLQFLIFIDTQSFQQIQNLKKELHQAISSDDVRVQVRNLVQVIEQIQNSENMQQLHFEVFLDQEYEVKTLFKQIVEKLGTQHIIDVNSKEDAMWVIMDYFSKMGQQNILYNVLNEEDQALYFKNHFGNSKAYERITSLVLRSKEGSEFTSFILQNLKEYQAQNHSLPLSFDQTKLRNTYLRLKNINKYQNYKLNERISEYILFLFRANKMWPEIIDFCENYSQLTGNSNEDISEIKNYYLSDALLQMPIQKNDYYYYNLLSDAVFQETDNVTPCQITQMTKAYLKDGNVDHALSFFESNLKKLRTVKQQREEFLVQLYDSLFSDEKLEYEDFKSRYLNSLQISNKCVKEAFAVNQLKRIIKDKNYQEIETLFQLQMVMKEERQVLQSLNVHDQFYESLMNQDVALIEGLTEQEKQRLSDLRLRKLALQSILNEKDVKQLKEIQEILQDAKINIFEGTDSQKADQIQKLFNLLSKEQIDNILQRTQYLQKAINHIKVEKKDIFDKYYKKSLKEQEFSLQNNIDNIFQERKFPFQNTPQTLRTIRNAKRMTEADKMNYQTELDLYNEYMYGDDVYDENDPVVLIQQSHDKVLSQMKEELLQAVNERRSKVLPIALNIFNKVQESNLSIKKLNDIEKISQETNDNYEGKIDEMFQKFDTLLNNPRSPLFSALRTLGQYKGDKGIPPFNKLYRDIEDILVNRLDYQGIKKENQWLEAVTQELLKNQATLKKIHQKLLKEQQDLGKDHEYNKSAKKWDAIKNQELVDQLETRTKQLYKEYQAKGEKEELSREEKLEIMRDVLFIEYGQAFTSSESVFPSFFSQDLIIFGLENNIPEAIRLGERMMSETGQVLSRDLSMAVKNYMLDNSQKYQEAVKKTGPIDNSSLYRRVKGQQENPSIMCLDDPYWQDFLRKNSKRQHMWKLPSHLAWDHKPRGIIDEIFDMKKIEDNFKAIRQFI